MRESLLLCNTSGAPCKARHPRPKRCSPHGLGAKPSKLGSPGSVSASRTPRQLLPKLMEVLVLTTARFCWCCPSLLDTVTKTILPHSLREIWTFVGYTAVSLGHGCKRHPLRDSMRVSRSISSSSLERPACSVCGSELRQECVLWVHAVPPPERPPRASPVSLWWFPCGFLVCVFRKRLRWCRCVCVSLCVSVVSPLGGRPPRG